MTAAELTARDIFLHALRACSIERAMTEKLVVVGDRRAAVCSEQEAVLDLRGARRLLVIAMGKAGASVLAALLRRDDITAGREIGGVLAAPVALEPMPSGFVFFRGAHPLPDEQSIAVPLEILRLLDEAEPDTFCLFLITGGASAMMELPLDESISLEDMIGFHHALVHSGASIAEMNCVRKHFSAVKGGRLARRAQHLRQVTLLVSDVAPQSIDALASGPTLPDTSTVAECRDILARYDLLRQFPESVVSFFSGDVPETPKPHELSSPHIVLISSDDLAKQARLRAEALGFTAVVDNTCDDWDYRDAAEFLLNRVRELRKVHRRVCLISCGEISVRVPSASSGAAARGGRNQHFVLHVATQMSEVDRGLTVLSCGSDGIDGNSPAAGAVISFDAIAEDFQAWRERAEEALRTFSSFDLLDHEGRAIVTGPTGNNLRDLRLLLAEETRSAGFGESVDLS